MGREKREAESGLEVFLELGEPLKGWRWVELKSAEELQKEQWEMGIAVAAMMSKPVSEGRARVWSLRDPDGKPHLTCDAAGLRLKELVGKRNRSVPPELRQAGRDFAEAFREEFGALLEVGPMYWGREYPDLKTGPREKESLEAWAAKASRGKREKAIVEMARSGYLDGVRELSGLASEEAKARALLKALDGAEAMSDPGGSEAGRDLCAIHLIRMGADLEKSQFLAVRKMCGKEGDGPLGAALDRLEENPRAAGAALESLEREGWEGALVAQAKASLERSKLKAGASEGVRGPKRGSERARGVRGGSGRAFCVWRGMRRRRGRRPPFGR